MFVEFTVCRVYPPASFAVRSDAPAGAATSPHSECPVVRVPTLDNMNPLPRIQLAAYSTINNGADRTEYAEKYEC